MKTRAEVEEFKRQWKIDPAWDIEDSGEEWAEYQTELQEFQREWEEKWKQSNMARLRLKALRLGVPGNTQLAEQWELLEYKISELQDKLEKHSDYHVDPIRPSRR